MFPWPVCATARSTAERPVPCPLLVGVVGRQVQPHQESLRTVYRSQILRNIAQSAGDMAGARMLVSPPRSQYATVTERELQNAAALYSA